MQRLIIFSIIVSFALSLSCDNPVNSNGKKTGTAIINCVIAPSKMAKPAELKPTTKADISFYDSQNTLLVNQQLAVSGNRITGAVSVKAGSGYRAELFCYDNENKVTHSGTASNVSIVAGQQTTITILLEPAVPEAPAASGPESKIKPGDQYTITWGEVSRAESYTIEEAADSDFTDPTSKTIVGTSESYAKNIDTTTTYYYRVRANNSSGSSGWSNTVNVTIEPVKHALILDVNPSGSGDTEPSAGSYEYDENTEVIIKAIPNQGYLFVNWTGDVADVNSFTTTVTMTGEKHVTANFEEIPPGQYSLTIAVNQSGWGTTNPSVGSYTYDKDTEVTITAIPAEGYRFVNWTGNVADPGNITTTVTLTSDTTVTAVFEEEPETQYTLTLTVNNSAWGETFPAIGDNMYAEGSTVSITAVPADGYRFVSWSGVVADATSATTTVTVTANSTVTAIFEKLPIGKYSLTMTVNQPGWGTTDPPPGASTHDDGSIVTITATPASGYRFVNWTGTVADASSATTTVTLNANVTVTANFEVISTPQFTLTMAVNQSGWGTTNPASGSYTHNKDTVVTITATPTVGCRFVNWTGSVANTSSVTTTVTMSGDMTVTANFEIIPAQTSDIEMVSIPGGSFSMGSNSGASDQRPVHTVTLDYSFEMSMYEITQGQYTSVIGTNPADTDGVGDYYPVYGPHWYMAVIFCNKLSDTAGLDKCYNESTGACDFTKNGYRLPTEAEWEYACRAGTTTAYYTGDSESDLARAGWYDGNSGMIAHPVCQKTPNAWGLYDMHGNVWEWCNDWHGSYSSESATNPTGAQTGTSRVFRGGGWGNDGSSSRSASRNANTPYAGNVGIGFRVVRGTFTPGDTKTEYFIYGTITGASGVTVTLSGDADDSQVVSTDGGTYSFTVTEDGNYTVTPSKTGYEFTPVSQTFNDVSSNQTQDFVATEISVPTEIEMVSIPGVTTPYEMASGYTVTLSAYAMSATEVTNSQYAEYLNSALASGDIEVTSGDVYGKTGEWSNQRYLNIGYSYDSSNKCWIEYSDGSFSVTSGYENRPVVAVTWYGSKAFAEYYGLDLPTEAEWQYAASGGRSYEYGTDDGTISSSNANYNNNFGHPTDAGNYPANPFGLYDMSGNVWEWCSDWYGSYPSESVNNPTGAQTGSYRVSRGGGWDNLASSCRSALRRSFSPGFSGSVIGFRVVRRLSSQ